MSLSKWIEQLEDRQLLAATPIPTNINLSRMRGNQSEGAVAVDPTNGNRMFVVSNIDRGDGQRKLSPTALTAWRRRAAIPALSSMNLETCSSVTSTAIPIRSG